jgi:Tol biopolymer transport system component
MKTFAAAMRGEIAARTVRANLPKAASPSRRRWWLWALGGAAGIGGIVVVGGGLALAMANGGLAGLLGTGGPANPTATDSDIVAAVTAQASHTPLPTRLPTSTASPEPTALPEPTDVPIQMGGGGRLAFVSDRDDGRTLQIWTVDPEGKDPQQLTFGPGDKHDPRWSPDGSRLLYSAPGGSDQFGNDLGLDLWLINSDGTGIKNISHHAGDDTGPSWSPDGRFVAFTSTRVNDLRQVFVMEAACLDEDEGACWDIEGRNISAGYAVEYGPAWSPTGGDIAVSASINGAPGRILLRGPIPGQPTRFDPSDQIIGAEDLAWSPDASLIAFTWKQPTMNEIWLVRISDRGANPIKLTNSLGNKEPVFSPDGQWIAFTSTRDQNPEIYLMTANGGNQTNLTGSPSSRDLQPDWQPAVNAP